MSVTKCTALWPTIDPFNGFFDSPITLLKKQRRPDERPKKPKPVTDEQLLAIVVELQKEIAALRAEVAAYSTEQRGVKAWVRDNFRLKFFSIERGF